MSRRKERGREIHDYFDVVAPVDGSEAPVVVGGQAANAWATYYSERVGDELRRFRPFTSKDIDLAGDRELLRRIEKATGGKLTYSEPRSPVLGMVEAGTGDDARKVEVLHHVKGLNRDDLDDAIAVSVGGSVVRLLSPPKVLKAKLCNAITLDQSDRNDVKHVRIMVLCVREFMLDVLESVAAGHASQRDFVDLMEEVREIVLSPDAVKAERIWTLDLASIWPRESLARCGLQKVLRFVEHRLILKGPNES